MNWKTWLYGLGAAFIQGGATAVTATLTAAVIAPQQFNPSQQITNFVTLAGTTFFVSGSLGAFGYLKQSPLPYEVQPIDQPKTP